MKEEPKNGYELSEGHADRGSGRRRSRQDDGCGLCTAGKEVRLWDQPRFAKTNFLNIEKTGITLSGNQFSFFGYQRRGIAHVALATDDLAKAVKGAGIIIVAAVALGHEAIFRELIPLLEDGQVIHILPDKRGTFVLPQADA